MTNIEVAYAGIEIVSKLLDFPIPELFSIEETELPNKEITGMYSFKNNHIILNEDWVNRSEWIEVLITVFHEMRHAYQGYCVRTKTGEHIKTLKKWEEEINGYIMPSGKNNEADDQSYLTQEIEIDAIAYTHLLIKRKFDIKTLIPNVIKDNVLNRVNELRVCG